MNKMTDNKTQDGLAKERIYNILAQAREAIEKILLQENQPNCITLKAIIPIIEETESKKSAFLTAFTNMSPAFVELLIDIFDDDMEEFSQFYVNYLTHCGENDINSIKNMCEKNKLTLN